MAKQKPFPVPKLTPHKKQLSNEVTLRFMIVCGEIMLFNKRNKGGHASMKAIMESIGASPSVASQFQDITRNVTVEMCCALCAIHGVNGHWLMTGIGQRYYAEGLQGKIDKLEQRYELLEFKINEIEKSCGIKSGIKQGKM